MSRLTIAALLIASAQTPLGTTMIAVGLTSISGDFAADLTLTTSLLVTTYIVVNLIAQSPGGKLADMIGRWVTVELGIAVFGAGAIIGAAAPHLSVAMAGRVLMAIGGALMNPASLAILRTHVAAAHRGKVFGVYTATVGLAAAIGPPLGGELVYLFGWRAIFLVNIPLLILAAILARIGGRPVEAARPERRLGDVARDFDWIGTALLAATLVVLCLGRLWALALGAAGIVAFVLWEKRARDPILAPRLFGNRVFAAACAVIALQSLVMYGLIYQLPQFFESIRGATPRDTGMLLFVLMIGLFAASIGGGALSDRIGARWVILGGVALLLAGLTWLAQLPGFTTPQQAYGAALLVGLGIGICWAPAQAAAMSAVDDAHSGMAAGATSTSRYLGATAGVLVLAATLNNAAGVAGHMNALMLFAIAILLSAVACLALPAKRRAIS